MPDYAIYRCEKIKTLSKLNQASRHNTRATKPEHADPRAGVKVLVGSGTDPAEAVRALLPEKRRKDAVLAMELLCTASPAYFRPHAPEQAGVYDQAKMEAWKKRALHWLKKEFGDRMVSAILHLDEATPHIQALVVPLDPITGTLNAKKLFGPEELKRQQDTYAKIMAPLGLQRGEPGSKAKHEPLRRYYKRVMAPTPAPPSITARKRPTPPDPPRMVDKIKEALGMRSRHAIAVAEYKQGLDVYKMHVGTDRHARQEFIEALAAKAREHDAGNDAARHRMALTRLRDEALKHDAASLKAAMRAMSPADRETVQQALSDDQGPQLR